MADRHFLLEYSSFREVLEVCASRLGEDGLLLAAAEAGSLGAEVSFEVRIRNGFSVLRGAGEIVGVEDDGIVVRFTYLDLPSQRLLPKLIGHYRQEGVSPLVLPEPQTVEPPAGREADAAETAPEPVSEPTAEELFAPDDPSERAVGLDLTLEDLEIEDLPASEPVETPSESPPEAAASPRPRLLDATPAKARDQPVTDFDSDMDHDEAAEVDSVDVVDLIADRPTDREVLIDGDSREQEIPVPIETPEESGEGEPVPTPEPEPDEADQIPDIDPGLSWLPDEEEPSGNRSLWILLLCIVLGALLGVAVYYLFLRPERQSSQPPGQATEVAAQPVAQPVASAAVSGVAGSRPQPNQPTDLGTGEDPSVGLTAPEADRRIANTPGPVLTRVDRITWTDESDRTVVILWADGRFDERMIEDFRVEEGAPREVVRIRGIRQPFEQQQIVLETGQVHRIRVGLHQEADGSALHFVADLVDGNVELQKTEAAGEQLRMVFSDAG